MRAKPIFVGGASSQAGKSWMTTAICAWLRGRGYRVAPFKAQNMSNNSAACRSGGEVGRAQAAQAEACGLEPETDMNPILLKPCADATSQVVLEGKVWRTLPAREYYEHFDFLLDRVLSAYERLAARFDYIVIEGAGSIAELNLKHRDLVNLGLAKRIGAPGLLVADIDRGGVFASIIGTFALLDDEERALMRSFAINRFRGDASLFESGVEIIQNKTERPCLGVFPMAADIELAAEDGVCIDETPLVSDPPVAIIRLPHISNFTDFLLIAPYSQWISRPLDRKFDCVILPGTKNTVGDLEWLRSTGLADWILDQHRRGASVIGVCGGYQMLGNWVDDPMGVESTRGAARGLGLIDAWTILRTEKTVRPIDAETVSGIRFPAYEIHMGETTHSGLAPFATLSDGTLDGARADRVVGTYLHGALECAEVASELVGFRVEPLPPKQQNYERLALWFEKHQRGFEELYL